MLGIGLPFGSLYILSTLGVANLNVTRTNSEGVEVQESFFSAAGVSGLKDLMTGEESRRRAAAEKAKAAAKVAQDAKDAQAALAAAQARPMKQNGSLESPERMGGSTGSAELANPDMLGGSGPGAIGGLRKDVAPKLRGVDNGAPAPVRAGGLDDTVAAKVVAQSQPAFQGCIEQGLRRDPGMRVGKVSVNVTVSKSGVVKSATIDPKKHESTNWGECLISRAKRMVFPPFEGDDEAEVQVPLVVGLGI